MMDHIKVQGQCDKECEFDYTSFTLSYKFSNQKKMWWNSFSPTQLWFRLTNLTSVFHYQWARGIIGDYVQAIPDCISDPAAWAFGSIITVHT